MFENIENLTLISSFCGTSKPYVYNKGRKSNGFLIRTGGEAVFKFADKDILTQEGDMIFLPEGIIYEFEITSTCDCTYTSLNFKGDVKNPHAQNYSLNDYPEKSFLYNQFSENWRFGNSAEKYKCLSVFYSLLSYVSAIENTDYFGKKKYRLIEPAIEYLKIHIFDYDLKVDNLHLLCNISDTYFRKIFISNFGMSPQKYIVNKRISHAKSLIDNGDFDSISELSNIVGYKDPLYFSRAFKSRYGVSPSNMNKQ